MQDFLHILCFISLIFFVVATTYTGAREQEVMRMIMGPPLTYVKITVLTKVQSSIFIYLFIYYYYYYYYYFYHYYGFIAMFMSFHAIPEVVMRPLITINDLGKKKK